MKGQVRLQLNQHPCTHWSVTFVREPTLNIKIDTNFLSTPLPQVSDLLVISILDLN